MVGCQSVSFYFVCAFLCYMFSSSMYVFFSDVVCFSLLCALVSESCVLPSSARSPDACLGCTSSSLIFLLYSWCVCLVNLRCQSSVLHKKVDTNTDRKGWSKGIHIPQYKEDEVRCKLGREGSDRSHAQTQTRIRMYEYTHTGMIAHGYSQAHTYPHTHTYTHVHTHSLTHIYTRIHATKTSIHTLEDTHELS